MSVDSRFDADILIVGAGIIGLAIGVELHRRGRRVVVLDPDGPARGASYGNAGYLSPASVYPPASYVGLAGLPRLLLDRNGPLVVRPGHLPRFLPWALRMLAANRPGPQQAGVAAVTTLNLHSVRDYAPLLQAAAAQDLIDKRGSLAVCGSPQMLETYRRKALAQQALGFDCQVVDADEARALEPALGGEIAGGVFYADAARCADPGQLGERFAAFIAREGGQLVRSKATSLRPVGAQDWIVHTPQREWRARRVIVAAGRWSDALMVPLGYKVPLESERGYHLMLPTPGVALNRPVVIADAFFTATPMLGGMRLAGTAEFAAADAPPDARRSWMLYDLARRHLPGLNADQARTWMGVRPALPDARPALGKASRHDGLYYCFGNHYQGLTQAATCARVMGHLLFDEPAPIALEPFDLKRFE